MKVNFGLQYFTWFKVRIFEEINTGFQIIH
jgi:hypothetical protein